MKKFLLNIIIFFSIVGCGKHPVADFTYTPQNPKVGDAIQFTNLSIDAKSYSWNFGDMSIGSETNPIHTYTIPGDHILDLTAHRGLKSNTKTITIRIQ